MSREPFSPTSDEEILRRSKSPASDFVDARELIRAQRERESKELAALRAITPEALGKQLLAQGFGDYTWPLNKAFAFILEGESQDKDGQ